jgi:hypothetical protein
MPTPEIPRGIFEALSHLPPSPVVPSHVLPPSPVLSGEVTVPPSPIIGHLFGVGEEATLLNGISPWHDFG